MQKTLELTIRINEDDFELDVYEPESNEIYSWISLWADEVAGGK